MVYSEVPNFSEPNPELLAQANQQNKTVSPGDPHVWVLQLHRKGELDQ